MRNSLICVTTILGALLAGCATPPGDQSVDEISWSPEPFIQVNHPDWTRNAVIYQINTRQFTPEGTFAAAQNHLPRLAELGVDILWLMPVHPIGEVKRKGTLGSPYAVKDYRGVNREFGTVEDLRGFVEAAHALDMVVILDWVANHTAWDHPAITSHRDWYTRDAAGEMQHPPGTDWTDVADLNFDDEALRVTMAQDMAYWVRVVGVDGFRADVAEFVPLDFWEDVRVLLEAEKPVFLLAEGETRDLHARAFDATYAWEWKNAMQDGVRDQSAGPVRGFYADHASTWPAGAMRMHYTSNHDQNAWDGTARAIYGDALEMAMVLAFTGEGIPLIYNGQEAGLDHQLAFFEKDEIAWREDHPHGALLASLIALKTNTSALWNGAHGAPLTPLDVDDPGGVFAFVRADAASAVLVAVNFTDAPVEAALSGPALVAASGRYGDVFSDETLTVGEGMTLTLPAWGYRVLTRSEG